MDYKRKAQIFMRKFSGRMDIYGKKWISKDKVRADGTPLVGYAPECSNFWKDVCHIKNKSGVSCGECEHQAYTPVTGDVVTKHIKGEEEHIYYLINPENNKVWFSAIDFDCKPGKEEKGYTFTDVERCAKVLKDWGIPYGIARSTTNGFHLYIFFMDEVLAKKPLAITHQLFEELGWSERARQGIKPIPEIFPKQASVGSDGLGNGIKPPMIESQMQKGRNCWVDDTNVVIPIDQQWQYFTDLPRCREATLDKVIEEYGIDCDLYTSGASVFRGSGTGSRGKGEKSPLDSKNIGVYFEKMLEGCSAFRNLRDKVLSGEILGHDEGFALIHAAMGTFDGKQWCHKHMSGWMETEAQMKQIAHSEKKSYTTWSCAKMQSVNICKPGTKCFEKQAPYDYKEGKLVKLDIPESKWPSPSPIRYAHGPGEEFLKKLKLEADDLKSEKDKIVVEGKLKGIINRSKAFDKEQQRELEKYLVKQKIVKTKELRGMFADMIIQKTEDVEEAMEDAGIIKVGKDKIQRGADGNGYYKIVYVKGKPVTERLTRTNIDIEETRRLIHDDGTVTAIFKGKLVCPDYNNYTVPFEIDAKEWPDPRKLHATFTALAMHRLNISDTKHMQLVSQAALEFAGKNPALVNNVYRTTQGWHKDMYITPSVIVSKEGVKENDQYKIDLSEKKNAAGIDFQILGEDELQETVFGIKNDLLNAFPKEEIYTGLAHTLMAGIRRQLGIKHKPTLWYEGLTGTGKSEVTKFLQPFYGDFGDQLPGWHASAKYLMDVAHEFKDCLAVIDDYKESFGPYIKKAAREVVQFSYDDVVRGTLTRTGQAKIGKHNRAFLASSGEDTPSQEASVLARMIVISMHRRDMSKTKKQFDAAELSKHKYNGVTPRFIAWYLQQDQDVIKKRMSENYDILMKGMNGVQNADRIVQNLSINMIGWQLWTGFMQDLGVATPIETEKYIQDHWDSLNRIKFDMANRCSEEQQSNIFINALRELLFAGEIRIEGLNGYDLRENARAIGFYKEKYPEVIYLWPDQTTTSVLNALRTTGFTLNKRSLAAQLFDSNYITERDTNRFVKSVRYKRGVHKVWVVNLKSLGIIENLSDTNLKIVPETSVKDVTEIDKDGLL